MLTFVNSNNRLCDIALDYLQIGNRSYDKEGSVQMAMFICIFHYNKISDILG